ncbi:hypothetical protein [Lentisphaera araneosa]|jgi:hypothetical protein|nr:hypothetical protein [Lentisphaera araneosa]
MRWSLARKRMYEACPRRYKYHYLESLYAFDEDRDFFSKKLYQRRHEKTCEEIFASCVQKIIPLVFCEGRRSSIVNKALDSTISRELMSYPEQDREPIKDRLYPRIGRLLESLLSLDQFKWLSPMEMCLHKNEFLQFDTDGVTVDLFVSLAWRIKGELNILRLQYGGLDQEAIALEALAFYKLYGSDLAKIQFWNLFIREDNCYMSENKVDLSRLFDVREMILKTRSLLNNDENDFPFTKNMALCESCKYLSLCERYE